MTSLDTSRAAVSSKAPDPVLPSAADTLSAADFRKLQALIETTLGINMPESKRGMVEARLTRRLRELGLSKYRDYCELLDNGRNAEFRHFLDLVTTNKTSFFREPAQFDALSDEHLPALLEAAGRPGRTLRAWSAACSTGQEVWTLAIVLESSCARHAPGTDYVVLGSDVSRRVLQTAIAAKYDRAELEDVPPQHLRHFMRSKAATAGLVRLTPELRSRAGFFRQNLMDDEYTPGGEVDLLFLRNALIYFPRERQMEIVARAVRHLRPGGLFVVSLTETLHGFPLPLTHLGRSIYRLERA